ncbi:MAG: DNA repair protein RadC [Saprospiraceae bacterium]|nr:DNA repair protein RadC [Bacteroidia bacterium]NNE15623.1 DNA repair protein RadC [Saprospiraceae bacterium]NNL93549.1 DNA repair protein RadC [Saprospiraceae bacterium]
MYNNNFPINKWAEEDRPREKLVLKGKASLSNAEILAILLGSGSRNSSAVDLAKIILSHYKNNLHDLGKVGVEELKKFKGIGEAKAIIIIAALELGRRRQVKDINAKPKIVSSQDAYECVHSLMSDLDHEVFKIILLNRSNCILKVETISVGGVSGTVVDPKIVFKKALSIQASSIILVHNHPSGNLQPSKADLSITKKISNAGEVLDIKVLDHLIISEMGYFSFADEGLM